MNKLKTLYSRIKNSKSKRSGGEEEKAEKVSPISAQLKKVAEKCLDYPLDRYSRIMGKVKGLALLTKLVKKIAKEKIILQDKDLQLLLRCSLHSLQYVSQKEDCGEFLMQHWMKDAKYCLEKSLASIEKNQVPNSICYILRYFQEEDRWNSLDMAIKVFKDLIWNMGEKNIENVEEDILDIFLNYMALFCAVDPSLRFGPFLLNPSKSKNLPIKENPLLPMSRFIHAMLSQYPFRSMNCRVWNILDTLFNLYINVAKTCEYIRTHPNQTLEEKRIWEEWDSIEYILLRSLRIFLDSIIFYGMNHQDKYLSPSLSRKKEKMHEDDEIEFGIGEALTKVMTLVMEHALDVEVPLSARNKLLDMLINATKPLTTARNFSLCLSENLLLRINQMALSGDPVLVLRSHQLIHHLIDGCNLRKYFQTPRIFTEKVKEFSVESDPVDWKYIKKNRNTINGMLFSNFLCQGDNRITLEAIYSTICLMLVQVQDFNFACDIAEMLLEIQDLKIINPDAQTRPSGSSPWIHATIASILSLIVVLYDMKDLKNQVLEVVNKRSQVAPFLLPPLTVKYTTGDVSDYLDDLFFSHALIQRKFNLTMKAEEHELTEVNNEIEATKARQEKINEEKDERMEKN